jgi:O-methyltransferase involved in polyketide biosynthesis
MMFRMDWAIPGRGSDAISPTALYTGHVWARNGLSFPELETTRGRLMYETVRPAMIARSLLGAPTIEEYLLARHAALDQTLERAIAQDGVSQVIEVAAGLSPRGTRFTRRHGALTYVEVDLPDMASSKREALDRMGDLNERHRVEDTDALRDGGPGSIAAVAKTLDPKRGAAMVTEGLLGYFPTDAVLGMWGRFAAALSEFPTGVYVAELHLRDTMETPIVRMFRAALSAFVRGSVHMHFANPDEAIAAALGAGFASADVRRADEVLGAKGGRGGELVHILEARA